MSAVLYLEGGGSGPNSKELDIRCREGFRRLLENCGFNGRMPRLFACGGRAEVFDTFSIAQTNKRAGEYIGMWIDSEEAMADINSAWNHLQNVTTVPKWVKPVGATDEQVLFMTTCMEAWIVADRAALVEHYGHDLQESALPALEVLEQQPRHDVQLKLARATRNCLSSYKKGKPSYILLGKLLPATLQRFLPSFARARQILNQNL